MDDKVKEVTADDSGVNPTLESNNCLNFYATIVVYFGRNKWGLQYGHIRNCDS